MVHRVITDLGVLDITPQGVQLVEFAPEVSFEEIQKVTGVPYEKCSLMGFNGHRSRITLSFQVLCTAIKLNPRRLR